MNKKITTRDKVKKPHLSTFDKETSAKEEVCDQETQTDLEDIPKEIGVQDDTELNKSHCAPGCSRQLSNVVLSLRKNAKSWVFFVISIYLLSKGNFSRGLTTLGFMLLLVYWVHWESHGARNWLTISHHYHHEQNNWFSHGIQILMEMQFGLLLPIINDFLFDNILDKWVIIMLYLFYTSVHNINYSIQHINKTHELHHENIFTNIGPDLCDLVFDTKNETIAHEEEYIEDTSHYIPNIIISTIIVLFLKKMYKYPLSRVILDGASYVLLMVVSLIIVMSNTYLMRYYA